ncbi:9173_t:CDS:2, partial [Scutellospora calospora]
SSSQEQKVNKENLKCSHNQRTVSSTLSMNDFKIGQQIGKGKYGRVYMATNKASQQEFHEEQQYLLFL